jgi:DNA-binding transcriptional ArsR family regulator
MIVDRDVAVCYHLDKHRNEVTAVAFQETFKALSDPTRRAILDLLKDGAKTAGDIAARFDMTGATVSHHLSVLREAGLVSDERRGKYIYYELNLSVLDEITGWVAGLREGNRNEK